MTPQYRIDSIAALQNTPVVARRAVERPAAPGQPRRHQRAARARRTSRTTTSPPTFDVQANVQGADLGSVSKRIEKIVDCRWIAVARVSA